MKTRDLVRAVEQRGFLFVRHGARHDIYGDGRTILEVPRHRETSELLARKIIKQAAGAP